MTKIYQWGDHKEEPVATCQCGSMEFYIRVNGYGSNWDKIIGTECVNCGDLIEWAVFEKQTAEKEGGEGNGSK